MRVVEWALRPMSAGFLAALGASLLEASSEPPPAARDGIYLPSASAQTEADEYTLYELLAPESARHDERQQALIAYTTLHEPRAHRARCERPHPRSRLVVVQAVAAVSSAR